MSPVSELVGLLGPDDPAPVILTERSSECPLVFCCDHAGAQVPEALGTLGLGREDLDAHIGIDVGIFAVVSWLSALMGAPMVAQPYSRLVIDSNRRPGGPASIPEVSDARRVPANRDLSDADRKARVAEILQPYQDAVAGLLGKRAEALGRPPILMAMHSFARRLSDGVRRDVDVGVIWEGENPFAEALLAELDGSGLDVRRNAPYRIALDLDYTIPAHAHGHGVPYVEIELCQDLIGDCAGQRRLADILRAALSRVLATEGRDRT